MNRIHRILGTANSSVKTFRVWPSAAALIGLVALLGVVVEGSAQTNAADKKPAQSKSKPRPKPIKKVAKLQKASKQPIQSSSVEVKPLGDWTFEPSSLYSYDYDEKTKAYELRDGNTKVHPLENKPKLFKSGSAKSGQVADKAQDDSDRVLQDWLSGKDVQFISSRTSAKLFKDTTYVVSDVANADLLNSDFAAAIQTVARQTGSSFVIAPGVFPRVSLKLVNMPAIEAFNAVCYAANASWRKQGSVFYFEHRKDGQDSITDRVTIHLKGVELRQAVANVNRLLGASIVLFPAKYPTVKTFDLDNATLEEALWALCAAGHAQYHGEGNVWTVSPL